MMTDMETTFSTKQALTSGADSTHVVDTGPGDQGRGNNISLFVSVLDAPASALTVKLTTSDEADMTGAVTLAEYPVAADLVKAGGVVIRNRLPCGCRRYLRLVYAGVAGGTVSAGLVKDA